MDERNSRPLKDDYVKFIRFGQWRIEQNCEGVLAFITNHSWLDNVVFRGMRQSLLNSFSEIYVLDLHGNSNKKETTPEGTRDENVFDIKQGVSITLFIRHKGHIGSARVYRYDCWGLRRDKYNWLNTHDVENTYWQEIFPQSPWYFFMPFDYEGWREYEQGWSVTDIFPLPHYSTGIKTHRDHFVFDFDKSALLRRIEEICDLNNSDEEIRSRFRLQDNDDWQLRKSRKILSEVVNRENHIQPCLYRPFDSRSLFYHDTLIDRPRFDVMQHMLSKDEADRFSNARNGVKETSRQDNLGLVTVRQVAEETFNHAFVSNTIVENRITLSNKGTGYFFPLYRYEYPPTSNKPLLSIQAPKRTPNLAPALLRNCEANLGLRFVEEASGEPNNFSPEDVFHYIYAILHSPLYRELNAEYLKIDFPRLPLTTSVPLFRQLAALGGELVAWHLLQHPQLEGMGGLITGYPEGGDNRVEKGHPKYDATRQRVYINKAQYFEGVPPELWEHMVGGYQVLDKWLKDRKGRTLTSDDITHYQRIVRSLHETQRLMREIDEAIGSFPLP